MALGVHSLAERGAATSRWAAIAHAVGGAFGGAAATTLLWLLAAPLRTMLPAAVAVALLAALAVLALGEDLQDRRYLPRGGQVPQEWLGSFGPRRAFFAYGAALGAGLATFVPYRVIYVVFAATALFAGVGEAVVVGALFGAFRALTVLVVSLRPEPLSRLIFRSSRVPTLFRGLSVVATGVIVAAVVVDAV